MTTLATTYWLGLAPLVIGLVGLFLVPRMVAWVEKYEPQTAIEPKSKIMRTWVKWAGLAGDSAAWHWARLLFAFAFCGFFAVMGILWLIGQTARTTDAFRSPWTRSAIASLPRPASRQTQRERQGPSASRRC